MPRPKDKTLDPAYWVERNRQDRHKDKTQIAIRVTSETHAAWHEAATRRQMTLKAWIIAHLNQAVQEEMPKP